MWANRDVRTILLRMTVIHMGSILNAVQDVIAMHIKNAEIMVKQTPIALRTSL